MRCLYKVIMDDGQEIDRCGITDDDFQKFYGDNVYLVVLMGGMEEIGKRYPDLPRLTVSNWPFIKDFYCLSGGYITSRDRPLVEFLKHYFMSYNLDYIAMFLDDCGYFSKSGKYLSDSHISNFLRKDLGLRKNRYGSKPRYKGRNWITG